MNHEHYDDRLQFVESILRNKLGLEPLQTETVEYDENCPFPFNNFIYRVRVSPLPSGFGDFAASELKPGTIPPPTDTSVLIVRLSNPAAEGLNNANRVQNEVAAIQLFRDALSATQEHLVPKVYGWGDASPEGPGWVVQEHMPGVIPDRPWEETLSLKDKVYVLDQIASILKSLQDYQLPGSVSAYGGLKYDDQGAIVSGEMTLLKGGPFATYSQLVSRTLESVLEEADESDVIDGWRSNSVRKRIDAFISEGVPSILDEFGPGKKVLVHSDFTTNNLLIDPETLQLTAILDFDWAWVGTVADEFIRSLRGIGNLPGPISKDSEQTELRKALLSGSFPDPLPQSLKGGVDWEVAKSWYEILKAKGAQSYETIAGLENISDLFWLAEAIAPWALANKVPLHRLRAKGEAEVAALREKSEAALLRFLTERGY